MSETISRYEVLQALDTGNSFNLIFITADKKRGTGGKIKDVKGWQKICGDKADVRLPDHLAKAAASKSKNPNHSENKTINIWDPRHPMQHATTVHWRLMIFFNNKKIID